MPKSRQLGPFFRAEILRKAARQAGHALQMAFKGVEVPSPCSSWRTWAMGAESPGLGFVVIGLFLPALLRLAGLKFQRPLLRV